MSLIKKIKKEKQHLKNIIDQIQSMTANIVFIRIIKLMSFNSLSFALNYPILRFFYDELNKFISLNPQKKKKTRRKEKKRLCIIICNYITCIWK